MPFRFAILHHTGFGDEHWDLMLEHEERLLTWQLPLAPLTSNALPLAARRIADHRKTYLIYEGPVSGNRGQVRRVDSGALTWLCTEPGSYEFILEGARLAGRYSLVESAGGWTLTRQPVPA